MPRRRNAGARAALVRVDQLFADFFRPLCGQEAGLIKDAGSMPGPMFRARPGYIETGPR